MRNTARGLIILTLLSTLIFMIKQFISFGPSIGTTDTPGLYLLLSIFGIFFVFASIFILLKYILEKKENETNRIELGAIIIQLMAAIFLVFFYEGVSSLFQIICYLGMLSIIIGAIGYYKFRHRINIAFISWGLGVLVWVSSFYFGMYVV